jgi:hypothetical protein
MLCKGAKELKRKSSEIFIFFLMSRKSDGACSTMLIFELYVKSRLYRHR